MSGKKKVSGTVFLGKFGEETVPDTFFPFPTVPFSPRLFEVFTTIAARIVESSRGGRKLLGSHPG